MPVSSNAMYAIQTTQHRRLIGALQMACWLAALTGLLLIAGLVFGYQFATDFRWPLRPLPLLAAFSFAALVALLPRVWPGRSWEIRRPFSPPVLGTAVLISCAAATWSASSSTVVAWSVWGVAVGADLATRLWTAQSRSRQTRRPVDENPTSQPAIQTQPAPNSGVADLPEETLLPEADLESELEAFPEDLVQQMTRTQSDDQGDCISGVIRCRLVAHQKRASEHVSFCPPLNDRPQITVHQIEGPDCTIKVGQAESFGVRFDLTVKSVEDESIHVLFEFIAQLPGHSR